MTTTTPSTLPTSRREARSLGLNVYRCGLSCTSCGGVERLVRTGACPACTDAQKAREKVKEAALRARIRATLTPQIRAAVLRELAQEQAAQARADEHARIAAEKALLAEQKRVADLAAMTDAERQRAHAAHLKATRTRQRDATAAEKQAKADAWAMEGAARFKARVVGQGLPQHGADMAPGGGLEVAADRGAGENAEAPPWD